MLEGLLEVQVPVLVVLPVVLRWVVVVLLLQVLMLMLMLLQPPLLRAPVPLPEALSDEPQPLWPFSLAPSQFSRALWRTFFFCVHCPCCQQAFLQEASCA